MSTSKTLHTEYDDATRNQIIGAMRATGKLTESANLVGMSTSAASRLWKKAQKTGKTKIGLVLVAHPSLMIAQSVLLYEIA